MLNESLSLYRGAGDDYDGDDDLVTTMMMI